MTETDDGKAEAIRMFEEACNYVALVFGEKSEQRKIAIKARGQMRMANGEPTT